MNSTLICLAAILVLYPLGVLVGFNNLKNVDLEYIDAKFVKKLDAWIGDTAFSGGRIILVDSCLSNVATDTMHVYVYMA